MLKIGVNSNDAQRLKNYKAPQNSATNAANDFAAVLFEVIKDRAYKRKPISIYEINEKLDKIPELNAQKIGVNQILLDMFQKMDAKMVKWLVRIILKDLKIGGQKLIMGAFHKDADNLYENCAELKKV